MSSAVSPATGRGPAWSSLFLGQAPGWYKLAVIAALAANALTYAAISATAGPAAAGFAVGWMLIAEFIACLAMALQCYPLLPGGLLALEALALGLTTPERLYAECEHNLPVILLLVFVVAGVGFLQDWLRVVFTRLLFAVRSKTALSVLFTLVGAALSAFLDALTVMAVVIAVCKGFHDVYLDARSRLGSASAAATDEDHRALADFRAFLRSLVMHAAIGTALGGVTTMVGEPQNLLIAHAVADHLRAGDPAAAESWGFLGFMRHMAPVTVPTFIAGLIGTVLCEKLRLCGHGTPMPDAVRAVLVERAAVEDAERTPTDRLKLWVQGLCAAALVAGLAFHIAEVGILGLFLIVVATSFGGGADEHRLGQSFTASLPFTALLVVFFAVVAVIGDQGLFAPVVRIVLAQDAAAQVVGFFCANAVLSAISDNVFVASVFINEASAAFREGAIDATHYQRIAVAVNTGTNIPSIATPNGQAAFLFLLTSPLAGPIGLGYLRMLLLALPYTVVMTAAALAAVVFLL